MKKHTVTKFIALLLTATTLYTTTAFANNELAQSIPDEDGATTPLLSTDDFMNPHYVQVSQSLVVRDKASTNANVIETLAPQDIVEVISYKDKYAYVMTQKGNEGYVMQRYLRPVSLPDGLGDLNIVSITKSSYSYAQMCKDLRTLQKRYPDILTVKSIGRSVDNRQIPVYVFGNPDAEHSVFIQASMHAREYMTSQLVMKQLEYFAANYETGYYGEVSYRDIFDAVNFHVVPMTNPDGIEISRTNGTAILKNGALKTELATIKANDIAAKKYTGNESKYYSQWKANANGVDINKNFDEEWGSNCRTLSPSLANFIGPSAASEPETKAIVKYMEARTFSASISYHAYGSIIYFESIAGKALRDQATDLAKQMNKVTGYTLMWDSVPEEERVYDATAVVGGGFKEWSMVNQGVPTVTLEIGLQACPLPITEFLLVWERNRDVFPEIALWAQGQ